MKPEAAASVLIRLMPRLLEFWSNSTSSHLLSELVPDARF